MEDGFEEFYKRYPRKTARADARKAWHQTAHVRPPLPVILAALDAYTRWREQLAAKRDFVPALLYPATWLRQERWTDEFDVAPVAVAPTVATPMDERAQQQRERERIRVMRGRAAWAEVVEASRSRSMPITGWSESDTDIVLRAIGGFMAVCDCTSRKALHELGLAFERAWVAPDSIAPSRSNVVQLRAVNG